MSKSIKCFQSANSANFSLLFANKRNGKSGDTDNFTSSAHLMIETGNPVAKQCGR